MLMLLLALHASSLPYYEKYKAWHNDVLSSPERCTKAHVLIFRTTSGIGATLNDLGIAFKVAVASERLFFWDWAVRGTSALHLALEDPGFGWDWQKVIHSGLIDDCQFDPHIVDDRYVSAGVFHEQSSFFRAHVASMDGSRAVDLSSKRESGH